MRVLKGIQQGSDAWKAERARRFTASEAPAMMGASKYQTRTDLLTVKSTGIAPEVNAATQALFDRGHSTEAAARVIVEEMLETELYPVTCVSDDDELLASLDGLTMDESTVFEHKLWSEDLANQVRAGTLEPHYYWQLEQELLVTGAERVIFVCSDGTREHFEWMEYRAVPGRAEQLVASWKQFRADLATFQPIPKAEKVKAEEVEPLPAIRVQVSGELTVADNLEAWRSALVAYVAKLPTQPTEEKHFAQLDDSIKRLKAAEKALEAEEERALNAAPSIERLRAAIASVRKLARDTRLANEKLVEKEKYRIKLDILRAAEADYAEHIKTLNEQLGRQILNADNVPNPGIPEGMASKKTIDGLRDGAAVALSNAKAKVNAIAERIHANLEAFRDLCVGHEALFADLDQLAFKDQEAFRVICAGRISEAKAREERRLEAERERIRAEEAAKAQREAAAQAEAERSRIRAEEQARAEQETRLRREQEQRNLETSRTLLDARQAAASIPPSPAVVPFPAARVEPEPIPAPAAAPQSEASMTLTALNARLKGLTVTTALLESLGIPPARTERNGRYYHDADFERIAIALRGHLRTLIEQSREQQRAAA